MIEDWSQQLIISVAKRMHIGSVTVDEGDLLPPLNFEANVLGPRSVELTWTPNNPHVQGKFSMFICEF